MSLAWGLRRWWSTRYFGSSMVFVPRESPSCWLSRMHAPLSRWPTMATFWKWVRSPCRAERPNWRTIQGSSTPIWAQRARRRTKRRTMWNYEPPLREMRYVIDDVLSLPEQWLRLPAFAELDLGTASQVLDQAARFAVEVLAPTNAAGDLRGCTWSS